MDTYNHAAYGERLTTLLKLFQGVTRKCFFESPNSDTLYALSQKLSEINHPVLVAVDGSDSDFDEGDADSLFETGQYYFLLLQPCRDDDPLDILGKQRQCKAVADEIQGQMRRESADYTNGLTMLGGDSFTVRSIGPVGDNLYGVIMGFQVARAVNFERNAQYWR